MDRTPEKDSSPPQHLSSLDRHLAELPDPREASDIAREEYFASLSEGEPVDEARLRSIAHAVIGMRPDHNLAKLEQFMLTGTGTHSALKEELRQLQADVGTSAEVRFFAEVLGTHLYGQEHEEHALRTHGPTGLASGYFVSEDVAQERMVVAFQHRPGISEDEEWALHRLLEYGSRRYGDPFRAFLRLPGVDASSRGLINYYLGVHQLEEDGTAFLNEATADQDNSPAVEAVEIGGQLHVFTR